MKANSTYMTRALASSDRRFAIILGKLGYTAPVTSEALGVLSSADGDTELTALRAKYQEKFGRRPAKTWDIQTLALKIAEVTAD
ncbi:hypothetical protein [Rhizobium rhizogenes]|uniref:hypothetical protein n=1 Tax=Rhizobium rhizogenes TaxID=359 RepID=UPI0024BE37B4|nr:hypothetical protein [Rhizobium rhizogenes]MDJ1632683.1 hypothetical protein [Rhizobium rhizogenes]